MTYPTPRTALHAFLYGGAVTILSFDIWFFVRALFTSNFIPLVPILVSILTATGLLLIVYAEQHARAQDRRDHRRLSRVAHQLESPLHHLQTDLHELTQVAASLPAEARLKLKRMETKTRVLLDNVRDVFLTLQVQEAPVSRDVRTYNACALIGQVVAQYTPLARARNVELRHTLHCEHAPVRVERQLFLIALGHLVENALLYTLTPGVVNIAVIKGKKNVRIVIQDRGIGIVAADQLEVFQPFARGVRAEQFDPDGIGVGLTLARCLTREWGGILSWHNRNQATGTEFEITLPLAVAKK